MWYPHQIDEHLLNPRPIHELMIINLNCWRFYFSSDLYIRTVLRSIYFLSERGKKGNICADFVLLSSREELRNNINGLRYM